MKVGQSIFKKPCTFWLIIVSNQFFYLFIYLFIYLLTYLFTIYLFIN